MKSINNLEIGEESPINEAKGSSSKDVIINTVKSEPEYYEEQSDEGSVSMEIPVSIAETESADSMMSHQQSLDFRNRRVSPMSSNSLAKRRSKKSKHRQRHTPNIVSADSSRRNNNGMRYFLLSLLPEFETMSEEQIRLFKIKVMLLIDELKTNDTYIRQSINSVTESNRLQKRLINLLLRNLKKTL